MIILIILIILVLLSFNLFRNLFKNDTTVLDDVKLKEEEPSNNGFALMLQKDDGTYEQSTSSTWPTDMKFNSELSGCIDVNGNKIDNALSFNTSTNAVTVRTNKTAYCYLYFDEIPFVSVYEQVISDYTNGNGVSKLSDSDKGDRDYDTYYYTGNITNNNVLYADHCWKMVITTEGNGVKMIYNGVPTDGSCDNSGDASTIGTSAFNNVYNFSLAYVGYMYNKVYTVVDKDMSSDTTAYVYGNSVTWDGSDYTLVNITSGAWSSVYNSLDNYHYTCFNTSGICSNVYYISVAFSSGPYYITLNNGKNVENAINEMLNTDDVNKYDSTIKVKVDTWYKNNILEKTDSYSNKYSDYLQNTIYCNDRKIRSLGSLNPNGGSLNPNGGSGFTYFNYNTLDCTNKTDQFTLRVDKGGENEYGNNALTYPIGLLNYKEASLAIGSSNTNYLNNSSSYFLMSPSMLIPSADTFVYCMNNDYLDDLTFSSHEHGIRPALTLSSNVKITIGDGSVNNPYQVKLSS